MINLSSYLNSWQTFWILMLKVHIGFAIAAFVLFVLLSVLVGIMGIIEVYAIGIGIIVFDIVMTIWFILSKITRRTKRSKKKLVTNPSDEVVFLAYLYPILGMVGVAVVAGQGLIEGGEGREGFMGASWITAFGVFIVVTVVHLIVWLVRGPSDR